MNRIGTTLAMAAALLGAGLIALPAQASKASSAQAGSLAVFDEAKYFSEPGVEQAKAIVSGASFDHGLHITVDTYPEPTAAKKAAAEQAKNNKEKWHKFMHDWAVELAQGDKAKGVFILVCAKPGGLAIIADRQTRDRGFTKENEQKVWDLLVKSFAEAGKEADAAKKLSIRDGGLKEAMSFIVADLKGSTVADHGSVAGHTSKSGGIGGMSIGGWICIGLVLLLGVWLVIGVFRALTGSGGGGYGPGGGGGGFMTSLFGGLFGAMAGMWLYNSFFGHGGGLFGGSDAYAGDSSGMSGGDTGAGDFSGDDGASGGFDGGGGDWGGGGGDFGGGDLGGGDF